jgi:hypothetical protein
MEQLGFEKRDILVDRVRSARTEQAESKAVFASAQDELRALVNVDAGELEAQYDRLNESYEESQSRAQRVRDRIEAVRDVAGRLFSEWNAELDRYTDAGLRRRSESQLEQTRERYEELIAAMDRAANRMEPVLELYEDQVLFSEAQSQRAQHRGARCRASEALERGREPPRGDERGRRGGRRVHRGDGLTLHDAQTSCGEAAGVRRSALRCSISHPKYIADRA